MSKYEPLWRYIKENKKVVFPHTIANKITGFVLFIAHFTIVSTNLIIFQIIICSISTFAPVQEGHYIRTRSYNLTFNDASFLL